MKRREEDLWQYDESNEYPHVSSLTLVEGEVFVMTHTDAPSIDSPVPSTTEYSSRVEWTIVVDEDGVVVAAVCESIEVAAAA
jgi:hypothetical protein